MKSFDKNKQTKIIILNIPLGIFCKSFYEMANMMLMCNSYNKQ
jgi:hypothetical protein